ncbi:hypothetical protein D8674_042866 [Pyrus ussuriensis x Pyrus communis]|uniref:F-box domain-containing protein n=1 Tax=Pyrus ussuriensis x Pyrus communis TaxID=2448454 RepID=A0A5N5G7J7_9ROSA|nr:hypothetical protein D8674_042866 [Pyrus ussuriensis x Pyrus communis]
MKMGQDMLVEILSNLPPKTLMRFKCVCKWWYARITNPSFTLKHLSNSANNSLTTLDLLFKRLVVQRQHEEEETEQVFLLLKLCKDDDNINDEDSNSYSLVCVR